MKTKIETSHVFAPGTSPHSQAIIANGFVFTQGCISLKLDGTLMNGTTEEHVHQIMKNLQLILEAAQVTFADVVKTTIYVTDMSLYADINKVYSSYFTDQYPARETVCVKELPLGAKIEISMIAAQQQ